MNTSVKAPQTGKNYGPAWWVWTRTYIFNLPPGVPLTYSEKRARKEAARRAAEQQAAGALPDADGLDAWTQPPLPEEPAPSATAAPAVPAVAPPRRRPAAGEAGGTAGSWAIHEEKGLWPAVAKILRVALVIVLIFFLWVGIRESFWPTKPTNTIQEVETERFPTAAGAEVAQRHVSAYLNIDPSESALEAREQALALDSGSGGGLTAGSVPGKQSVDDLAVVRVAQLDDTRARALVTGTLTDWTADGDKWTAGASRPIAAEVLLVADATGAVTVMGRPALVATTPGAVAIAPPEGATQDSTITSATRPAAESFFSSYGEDEAVTASTAPGVNIAGLGGGAELARVTGWTVYDGTDSSRAAIATVTWTLPSGIELTQTYALTLTSVSADEAGGWQISAISGGGNTQ